MEKKLCIIDGQIALSVSLTSFISTAFYSQQIYF